MHATTRFAAIPSRRPVDVARGVATGIVGTLCCLAGAITVGLGLGGASFFTSLMRNYQPYFMAASLLLLGVFVTRAARRARTPGAGLRSALRSLARPLGVMGIAWVATLVVALLAARAAGLS